MTVEAPKWLRSENIIKVKDPKHELRPETMLIGLKEEASDEEKRNFEEEMNSVLNGVAGLVFPEMKNPYYMWTGEVIDKGRMDGYSKKHLVIERLRRMLELGGESAEFASRKLQEIADSHNEDAEEEDWVTIKGTHVLLNEEGEAQSGGKLKGMTFKDAKSQKSTPKSSREQQKEQNKAGPKKKIITRSEARQLSKKVIEAENEVKRTKWDVDYCNKDIASRKKEIDEAQKKYDEAKASFLEKSGGISTDEIKGQIEKMSGVAMAIRNEIEEKFGNKRYSEMSDDEREEKRSLREKARDAEEELSKMVSLQMEAYDVEDAERVLGMHQKFLKQSEESLKEYKQKLDKATSDIETLKAELESSKVESGRTKEETLSQFKSASDCKTAEDATDYLIAKGYFKSYAGGSAYSVDLDRCPDKVAVSIAERIESMCKDYPFLSGTLTSIECPEESEYKKEYERHESAFAFASGTTVVLNPKYFENEEYLNKRWEDGLRSSFHCEGTTASSIIDHEYIHVVENALNEKLGGKRAADIVMERTVRRAFEIPDYIPVKLEDESCVRLYVSGYARENNGVTILDNGEEQYDNDYGRNTEFLAEAVSGARCSSSPNEYMTIAKEELEKLIKEVFG